MPGTLRRTLALLPATSRRRWRVLVALEIVAALAEAATAGGVFRLIALLGRATEAHAAAFALALAGVVLAKNALLAFVAWRRSALLAEATAAVADRLVAAYLTAPWPWHLRRNSAQLVRTVRTAVTVLCSTVLAASVGIVAEGLVVASLTGVLLVVSPRATLGAIAALGGLCALLLHLTRRRVRVWSARAQTLDADLLRTIQHTLGALPELRVLGRAAHFRHLADAQARRLGAVKARAQTLEALPRVVTEGAFVGGGLALAATLMATGWAPGDLLPLLALFAYAGFRTIPSANRIVFWLQQMRAGATALSLVEADVRAGGPAAAPEDGVAAARPAFHELRFAHVGLLHAGATQPSLDDVSFTLRRGDTLGVVGHTGAGKSTLVALLLGLLAPTSGRITVDGRPPDPAWQRRVGWVPQSPYVLDDSLRRNVALGIPDDLVDDDAVWEALRLARLDARARLLPQGLDTRVGERGAHLSGGERQRLALARALYHAPDVLVLDEATAALDGRTEAEVMAAVEGLRGRLTVVTVAHRLSTVRRCDRILVLRDGRLVDGGPWDTVLARSAELRSLAQAAGSGGA